LYSENEKERTYKRKPRRDASVRENDRYTEDSKAKRRKRGGKFFKPNN